ncbi:Transmembrane protein [Hirschfeldia incana]|nr:Transmembrane protein [Hirschfeldia incana]
MKLYMHPLVLFLCQLLVWLYLFFLWLVPHFLASYSTFLSFLVTFSKLSNGFLRVIMSRREVNYNVVSRQEIKNTLVNLELSRRIHNPVPSFSFSFKDQVDSQLKVLLVLQEGKILEDEDFCFQLDQEDGAVHFLDAKESQGEEDDTIDFVDVVNMENNLDFELQTMPMNQENKIPLAKDDDDDEEEDIVHSDMGSDLSSIEASDRDQPSPFSISSFDSAIQDSIVVENQTHQDEDDETDEVYNTYCERMRWYDILSRDRTYGLSVMMNQETASTLSLWGITAEKRLKQSIEKDLELVYVAQSCLSWEALQHQYLTVQDSLKSADSERRFYNDEISKEFQKFQVLLERFLEDERCEGKRVLSFVQRRFELISFFQVPRLSGYKRKGPHEREGRERNEKQVLEAIERCITVFYDFVRADIKRPLVWERLKTSFVDSPLMEVEDPRDIKHYLDLKNLLQKKEQSLKEAQGKKKKKIWFKKKKSPYMDEDETEKDEISMLVTFIKIELKLVSRVLQMSLVSSSHLKWCQHKLNNIDLNGGKLSRTSSTVLFPSS